MRRKYIRSKRKDVAMILVASVRHTGTMFVFKHLFQSNGINRHFGEAYMHQLIKELDNYPCVVPLRKLDSIIASWRGRQLSPEDLDNHLHQMRAFIREYKPFVFPIDADNREQYLEQLNRELGTEIKTTWPVINKKPRLYPTKDNFYDVVKHHKEWFDKVYSGALLNTQDAAA